MRILAVCGSLQSQSKNLTLLGTAARCVPPDVELVLFDDLGELPHFNPEIEASYQRIEAVARQKLLGMVPDALRPDYAGLFQPTAAAADEQALVKAADKLCAYLKCLEEIAAGNREFVQAERALRHTIEMIDLPEVRYFLETFVPSFRLTLDDLT